jgi:hypothetical protein
MERQKIRNQAAIAEKTLKRVWRSVFQKSVKGENQIYSYGKIYNTLTRVSELLCSVHELPACDRV